jgi:hypothetical protein
MKLKNTHLKAPWPAGAKVGDVVSLPKVPGWAIGKCDRVDDSTEATIDFPEEAETAEHPEVARMRQATEHALKAAAADAEQARDTHAAEVRNLKADHTAALAELQARLDQAIAGDAGKHQALLDANAELTKQLAEAHAALATATKAHPKGR